MQAKDDKRKRIMNAAVKVFSRKGFYNARVADIARHAGVADGTIYLYFKNKDEILISIFEEEMAGFISQASGELAKVDHPAEKLRSFIKTHLAFVRKNPTLAQVFQVELRQSNKFIKEYSGSMLREYLNLIGGVIREGQETGVIRRDLHPGLVKRAIFGALDEVATHWVLRKDGRYDLQRSAEQIAALFIEGVASVPVRELIEEGRP